MKIVVGPLDEVRGLIATHAPTCVISLLAPGQPGPVLSDRPHLRLDLHDIDSPRPGLTPPGMEAVDRLLAFGGAAGAGPVLVHCWFAISRSPAAAYILACAAAGGGCEDEVALRLRAASPECTPNPRLVALADARLGRGGRMIDAVARLGRGCETDCGRAFTLEA